MTENAYYVSTLPVVCPKCGKTSQKLLRELVVNDLMLCSHCPTVIDVSSADWRAKSNVAVENAKRGIPSTGGA